MGLTKDSSGKHAGDGDMTLEREHPSDRVIALMGNPNVGKSTVFNALTGMNQHTGNWPGKTVGSAYGRYQHGDTGYILVDLPGTYSLMPHSAEEEVARDFLLYGGADTAVVVCDATCLERNLNLVLQTMEVTPQVVVCVNLLDEAKKKGIRIDLKVLEKELGVPVVGTSARVGKGLDALTETIHSLAQGKRLCHPMLVSYSAPVEQGIALVQAALPENGLEQFQGRFLASRLLANDALLERGLQQHCDWDIPRDEAFLAARTTAGFLMRDHRLSTENIRDELASALVRNAEKVAKKAVRISDGNLKSRDRKIDRILTSRRTGIPIMLLLLCGILWLTIEGANIPSAVLSEGLFWLQDRLTEFFRWMNAPDWLHGALVLGVYRTLAWVVSVMLPPMAIFFPLFTLLEDFGYLPRVAFNLDHFFKKACACGKQALTMCMGFGCNAAGVTGCRIIDSPRERLIAIITNSFVPCNGRFPTLIAILSMFFVGQTAGLMGSLASAALLTGLILLGILLTLSMSKLLSKTVLKGEPSSFTLELPPYRTPQIGKVLVRSLLDRTLFVLGRAAVIAAPAGLVLWLMANLTVDGTSLLNHCAAFLDPFANLLGLDGVILIAFILGFPANEIVVPIILMAYLSTGSLLEMDSLTAMKSLLVDNGWTWVTAVSTMLFCLVHWPCSTTCLTIKKETESPKWTTLSILLPTVCGLTLCFIFTSVVRLFGFV